MREPLAAFGALALLTGLLFLPALDPGSTFYFRDISQNHHPYRQLSVSMMAAGEAPLWNPVRGAGQPLLANPNALILHPTTLLFFLIPFEAAFKASVILQIFLAAAGGWLLLRDMGASRGGALLGACLFAFSGFVVSLGNLLNLLDGASFMPLTLWLAGRAVTRGFAPWGSLAAVSLAVQVASGEPAILLCTAAAFVALHWSFDGAGPRRPIKGRLAAVAGIVLLAPVLSMVAILPAAELLVRSERGAGFDREEALKWSLPPAALPEAAVAGILGDPTRAAGPHYRGGKLFDAGLPFILSLYLGPAALLLAGIGLMAGLRARDRSRRREALALGALSAGAVILALGRFLPLYPALLSILPPLQSVRYPVKYFLAASWGVAVLAARGFDAAAARPAGRENGRPAVAIVTWWLAAVWGGVAILMAVPSDLIEEDLSPWLRAGSILFAAWVFVGSARERSSPRSLLLLAILDLVAANARLNPVAPLEFYSTPPRVASLLGETADTGRVWAAPRPPGFAFRSSGDDGASLRWGFLWDRMTLRNATYFPTGFRFAYDRGNERLDVMPGAAYGRLLYDDGAGTLTAEQRLRLLAVAGVSRLITYGGMEGPGLSESGRLEGESRPPVVVMSVAGSLPRARVVSRVEVHPDLLRASRRLREPSFDPLSTVILEEGGAPASSRPGEEARDLAPAASIVEEGPARVVVKAAAPAAAYLVLADTFYPGWIATVDGEPRPIRRADTMFRAVEIPAGTHVVEFRYKPSSVRSGLMVTAAGLLLAALLAVPRRP